MQSAARPLTVAVTQFSCGWDRQVNIDRGEELLREAARAGAQVVLLDDPFSAVDGSASCSPCPARPAWRTGVGFLLPLLKSLSR
jgi:hypothetical protein